MSDEQERPLTRRELRMREGWVQTDTESNAVIPAQEASSADSIAPVFSGDEPSPPTTSSIPVIGPDGQLMSRRQLRALWEAEAAEAAGSSTTAETAEPDATPSETASAFAANDVTDPSQDAAPEEPSADLPDEHDVTAQVNSEPASSEAESLPVDTPSQKLRFPWSRAQKNEPVSATDDAEPSHEESGEAIAEPLVSAEEVAHEETLEGAGDAVDAVDDAVAADAPTIDAQENPSSDVEASADTSEPVLEPYSFPEVSPDPESRSIFDIPVTNRGDENGYISDDSTGGFDDIITRAVADEGAASPTNTSALILPSLPDSTDLSGALNETGEILITGSIELPKTLGETGGHIIIHDTLDPHEAAVLGHDFHEIAYEPAADSQPISAKKAVSARAVQTTLVGPGNSKPSRLPMVLAITASGLFVVIAGVFVWAASTGLFG